MIQPIILLAAAATLAACAAPEGGATAPAAPSARDVLAREAQQGRPVPAVVQGQPLGLDQGARDRLVTGALAEGVRGLSVRFTTALEETSAGAPRLVVVLDPAGPVSGGLLCRDPAAIATGPGTGRLQIAAAFCQAGEPLSEARVEGPAEGTDERQVKRLLWRTAGELFPDDYAQRYGLGILPDWLNVGVGGSFGF